VSIPTCPGFHLLTSLASQVFPVTPSGPDRRDIRDMEGPTMRERMAQELAERVSQGSSSAPNA